jgi:cytochrome oxidase Cu insertion factor (SCO1/SenC/PrrC family)
VPFLVAAILSYSLAAFELQREPRVASEASGTAVALASVPAVRAPSFSLFDQHGSLVSLDEFRGRAVLLAFMDSRCTLVCPLIAAELLQADHQLGPTASQIEFVAINVNASASSVNDVARFTKEQHLERIQGWHFLTGTEAQLLPVWKEYGITVAAPVAGGQTLHGDYMYLISTSGKERYLAAPIFYQRPDGSQFQSSTELSQWGTAIAAYLRLLAAGR